MDKHEVTSKAQLVAALKAGSCESFCEAHLHPFEIKLGSTTYTFKSGLHDVRLNQILKNIGAAPASAFAQALHGNA
jgi:hypothetical protein